MGMRSKVFDLWLIQRMDEIENAIVIHTGCGMDSRVERVGTKGHLWYDVDFPEVIQERKKYYEETKDDITIVMNTGVFVNRKITTRP